MTSSKLHLIGKYVIVARYKKFLLYSTQFSVPAFLSCGERSFQTKCSCNVEHTGLAEVLLCFLCLERWFQMENTIGRDV